LTATGDFAHPALPLATSLMALTHRHRRGTVRLGLTAGLGLDDGHARAGLRWSFR